MVWRPTINQDGQRDEEIEDRNGQENLNQNLDLSLQMNKPIEQTNKPIENEPNQLNQLNEQTNQLNRKTRIETRIEQIN